MAADALNKKVVASQATLDECGEIEAELVALRVAYEQFFLGVERQPPREAHKALKQRMNRLQATFVRQTAAKFRVANLHTKLVTYERLWERTIMEMENGTYRRDVYKARRKTVQPPTPAPAAAPAAAAPQAVPLTDQKLKAVYDAFITAKRRCNEDVSKLSFDSLASTLRKQVPALLKQHNASGVEFKVVIKDGKAVLRAVPK
jgi:hypothetical protein